MNTRYSDKLKQTFVVGASELKKLYGILQDRIGEVYILAHCADNLYREFETVKDLIAYENPKSKEIRHIRLSARSNDYSKSATIDFFGSSWRGISIDCTGCQDDVSKFKEDTLDVIAGMRAWYDVMHRIYFVYAIFGLFFIVSFYLVHNVNCVPSCGVQGRICIRFQRKGHKYCCIAARCDGYHCDPTLHGWLFL